MRWLFINCFAVAVLVSFERAEAANAEDRCEQTRRAIIELSLRVSNLTNLRTTRTPEGGPYKPWICASGSCEPSSRFPILKYEPDHPDADENGMVAYPNLDRDEEYQGLLSRYAELTILAKIGACRATYVDTANIKGMLYDDPRIDRQWVAFFLEEGRVKYVFSESRKKN